MYNSTVCGVCRAWKNGLSLLWGQGVFIGGQVREDNMGLLLRTERKEADLHREQDHKAGFRYAERKIRK